MPQNASRWVQMHPNGSEHVRKSRRNRENFEKPCKSFEETLRKVLENFFPENLSEIRVYYKNLADRFEVNEFSNRSLIKIADHFLESNPQISINCYREIKNRGDSVYLMTALLRLHRLYNDQGIEESVEITENELKHAAIIYGENDFNSLTKDDKIIFDQIMDSTLGESRCTGSSTNSRRPND